MVNHYSLLFGLSKENEEENFLEDLDSYTDVMSNFEDK